jgi:predicted RNA-binding protein with PUA-like domain
MPTRYWLMTCEPAAYAIGVTGLARIARAGYPDPFAWKKGHR